MEVLKETIPMATFGQELLSLPDGLQVNDNMLRVDGHAPLAFITPEASQVSNDLEMERFHCELHGPYMADKDGEMGGCLACSDIKLNINISRDNSYSEGLLDAVLMADSLPADTDPIQRLTDLLRQSRQFDDKVISHMSTYSGGNKDFKRVEDDISMVLSARKFNACQFNGIQLVREGSRDDFEVSYMLCNTGSYDWGKATNSLYPDGEGSLEKSNSVPEKLHISLDIGARRQNLWATLSEAGLDGVMT